LLVDEWSTGKLSVDTDTDVALGVVVMVVTVTDCDKLSVIEGRNQKRPLYLNKQKRQNEVVQSTTLSCCIILGVFYWKTDWKR
jgi:hypothetical protein